MIRRDFRARFTGSALGVFWAVLQPLSLVILYWFVFTFMIPRGPGLQQSGYAYFLISGLLPWIGFNEGIMRSTTSVVDNSALVRSLALRSEVLVVVPNASALIFEVIGLCLFLIFLLLKGSFPLSIWILPVALALQFVLQVGIGWMLAPLFVFFRDLGQIIGFLLSILFYLSPILYEVSPRFAPFFAWNPLTPLLGLFRSAFLSAPLPSVGSIVLLLVIASALFMTGLWFFRRAQTAVVDLM